MDSYFLASFSAFIIGWIAMQLAFVVGFYWPNYDIGQDFLWILCFSWFASLIFHAIFIQLPRNYIKRTYENLSLLPFALVSSLYGLAIITVSFCSFPLFQNDSEEARNFLLVFLSATITNGFAFGIAFHSLYKPNTSINSQWTTPTTPN